MVFGNQSKTGEVERMKYNILAVLDEESEKKAKKEENEAIDTPKLSKKKLKKATRLSVAELKQLVNRPDVVEMQDVTARDPKLLVHLKSTRNTVAVPRHWCAKRKYLQGKCMFSSIPQEKLIKKTTTFKRQTRF
jgi:splicing factor 3B subunit 2